MKIKILLAAATLTLIAIPATHQAQVSYTSGTYTQNFNSFTNTNLTAGAVNNLTMLEVSAQNGGGSVNGWYIYGTGGARWGRSNGATTTGGFYAMRDGFGGLALGSLGSNSNSGFFGVVLQNNSAITYTDFTITYDAVINRNPSTTVNNYPLTYLISNTAIDGTVGATGAGTFNNGAGTWNTTTLGFTTPNTSTGSPGPQAAINPFHTIGNVNGTISGISWAPGQYLYIRWQEIDEHDNDAMAGIDNFTFVAAPEPSTYAVAILLLALLGYREYRRRKTAKI